MSRRAAAPLFAWLLVCLPAGGQAGAQERADSAMQLLKKAVKAGYDDVAFIASDKSLDSLRDRADFKKLLDSLRKPK